MTLTSPSNVTLPKLAGALVRFHRAAAVWQAWRAANRGLVFSVLKAAFQGIVVALAAAKGTDALLSPWLVKTYGWPVNFGFVLVVALLVLLVYVLCSKEAPLAQSKPRISPQWFVSSRPPPARPVALSVRQWEETYYFPITLINPDSGPWPGRVD